MVVCRLINESESVFSFITALFEVRIVGRNRNRERELNFYYKPGEAFYSNVYTVL